MMTEYKLHPIEDLDDISLLVDTFYGKIREDKLLAPIFNERIQDKWPTHLAKMVRFWQTVLLKEHTYYGAPFLPHRDLDVEGHHFRQWLTLWFATLEELFTPCRRVDEAKWRAMKMAEMFEYKITGQRSFMKI